MCKERGPGHVSPAFWGYVRFGRRISLPTKSPLIPCSGSMLQHEEREIQAGKKWGIKAGMQQPFSIFQEMEGLKRKEDIPFLTTTTVQGFYEAWARLSSSCSPSRMEEEQGSGFWADLNLSHPIKIPLAFRPPLQLQSPVARFAHNPDIGFLFSFLFWMTFAVWLPGSLPFASLPVC